MTVYVNDKPVEVPPGTALAGLLKAAGRDPGLTLAAVDGKFVPRAEYRSCRPEAGAKVRAWELPGGG